MIIKPDNKKIKILENKLIDKKSKYPRLLKKEYLDQIIEFCGYDNWIYFCYKNAIYQYPTLELVTWIKIYIKKYQNRALEIGSGDNGLNIYLNIKGTDNYHQCNFETNTYYKIFGQTPTCERNFVKKNVEKIDAINSIKKYNPLLVIGSWITPVWDDELKIGNYWGPDYNEIINLSECFIMIGNERIHGIFEDKYKNFKKIKIPGLVSRASQPEKNCIYIFSSF